MRSGRKEPMSQQKGRKPLYIQVKQYLYNLILSNFDKDDYLLPSENALCQRFSISRITAKRALNDLCEEGYVIRVRGKGSFIGKDKSKESLLEQIDISSEEAEVLPPDKPMTKSLSKHRLICVILPDLKSQYYMNLLTGITETLQKKHCDVILATTNFDQAKETEIIKSLANLCYGMIILPVNSNVYNTELLRLFLKNYPIVLVDNEFQGINANCVSSDNYAAAYAATEFLIKKGKKHIGLIKQSDKYNQNLAKRTAGYEAALIANNILIQKKYIFDSLSHYDPSYREKLNSFLDLNPELDALIALNFDSGISTLNVILERNGKLTPDNVIFFDKEFGDFNMLFRFNLHYIEQDAYAIGVKAATLLLDQNSNAATLPQKVLIPTKLSHT